MKIVYLMLVGLLLTFPVYAKTAEDWLKTGNEFYQQGNYQNAIEAYTKAIELNPDYATAYNNRGFVFYY